MRDLLGPEELIFRAEFDMPESHGKENVLELPGRRGCISVYLDGEMQGICAWQPNLVPLGEVATGRHTLELRVVGDGIGVLRGGPYRAGLTAAAALVCSRQQ